MKKILSILCALSLAIGSMSAKTIYCKMEHSWWKTDGAAVGAYAWTDNAGSNANWPGVRMTPVEGMADTWSIDIDETQYKKIIFTRVNGSGTINDWGAKTNDLTIPTDGKNFYTITQATASWGDSKCSGAWSTLVTTKYAVTFGVIGENGTLTAAVKGSAIASGDEVADQSEVVFTAAPAEGYELVGWYSEEQGENAIADAGTALTYTATVGAATAVYVKFAAITTKEIAFLNTAGWESVFCTPNGGAAVAFTASEDVVWVNNGDNLAACTVWKGALPLAASEVVFGNGSETLSTIVGEGMFNAQAQAWGVPFTVAYGDYITVTNVAEETVFPTGSHVWNGTEVAFAAAREGAASFDGWFSDAAFETAIDGATETAYTATITADTQVYAKFTMASLKVYWIDGRNWNSTMKMVTWAKANESATAEYNMTKLSNNIFVAGAKYSKLYCAEYTTTEHDMCKFTGGTTAKTSENVALNPGQVYLQKSSGYGWKGVAYSVTFGAGVSAKVGTSSASSGDYVLSEDEVTITFTATVPEGQVLDGWYSDEACTARIDEAGTATEYKFTSKPTQDIAVYVKFGNGGETAIDATEAGAEKSRKFIENGQLFIQRGAHVFNALGQIIR